MRPLRFRAWNPETKRYDPCWYPLPGGVGLNGELELIGFYDDGSGDPGDPGNEQLIEDGAAIEQWTGLKDRNGRDIYEGDILERRYGERAVCVWLEDQANYALKMLNGEFEGCHLPLVPKNVGKHDVVIGNVHDNPELLEVPHGQDQQPQQR